MGGVTALDGITRPTLVVDRARAERNIARMAAKAAASGTRFRPHVKTHQSPGIAAWYRAAGVDAITVSSVAMAERFAAARLDRHHDRVPVQPARDGVAAAR